MAKAKAAKATGFVLPRVAVSTREPQTLGGLPGIWVPGQVHLASEFGLTDDDVRAFIKMGYPVREVTVEAKNEEELKKALRSARVDEFTTSEEEGEPDVEGTKLAEETVSEPEPDEPEKEKK